MRFPKFYSVLLLLGAVYLLVTNCQGEQAIRQAQYHTNGYQLYVQHCQNCHGAKGEGLGKLYPPLTDGDYLEANRSQLPRIVRFGMDGPIVVEGQEFNTQMPPNPQLSDIEIAYILTYITNSFGHSMGIYDLEEVHSQVVPQRER